MKNRYALLHILKAIDKIEQYVAVGEEEFCLRSHWQDSIIRQLAIVGEAVRRLSLELRSKYPDVPWKRIVGFRDVLIHDYDKVDLSVVWSTATIDIPVLKARVKQMLDEI